MNTIRLRFSLVPLRVLNSSPMIGIEPRIGTRFSLFLAPCRVIRPPSTMTPPSSTSTVVVIVRLFVIRSTAPCVPCATLESSCSIFSMHRVAFVDLRRDLEDRADFLALNRLERIHLALLVRTPVFVN